jgi:hypothetical protein
MRRNLVIYLVGYDRLIDGKIDGKGWWLIAIARNSIRSTIDSMLFSPPRCRRALA